jgi:hypothetical protein
MTERRTEAVLHDEEHTILSLVFGDDMEHVVVDRFLSSVKRAFARDRR